MKLFIHIPKNAGSALANDPWYGPRVHRPTKQDLDKAYFSALHEHMRKRKEDVSEGHCRYRDVSKSVRMSLSPIAIIRNPWDRVVSRWTFYQKVVIDKPKYKFEYKAQTFEEFLDERFKWGMEPFYWHRAARGWYPQVDYVCDEKGVQKVDCLRFDQLSSDAMSYFNAPAPIQYKNVSNGDMKKDRSSVVGRKPYQDYYNNQTIQIVADWYKKDIEHFDFDFDTGARKNVWALKGM